MAPTKQRAAILGYDAIGLAALVTLSSLTLRATVLEFEHPAIGERMRWASKPPKDMAGVIEPLRRGR